MRLGDLISLIFEEYRKGEENLKDPLLEITRELINIENIVQETYPFFKISNVYLFSLDISLKKYEEIQNKSNLINFIETLNLREELREYLENKVIENYKNKYPFINKFLK
ncbi:MAG: hypothetical protein QW117_01770 [Candidatus Pacearchaeota archaeon]